MGPDLAPYRYKFIVKNIKIDSIIFAIKSIRNDFFLKYIQKNNFSYEFILNLVTFPPFSIPCVYLLLLIVLILIKN